MTIRSVGNALHTYANPSVVSGLSDWIINEYLDGLAPRLNKYISHTPTPKQWAFLSLDNLEALFGGQAGGGKSDCLLMAALQYVDVPHYAALLLRRTYADLQKPGSLIPRSHEWLQGTDAHWRGDLKQWSFPSGAVLDFGYLDHDADVFKYQSSEYQFVGFDELTQFLENWYRYLFSRTRRLKDMAWVPIRVRGATNPGGIGHDWVKRRFIVGGREEGRMFVPSSLEDNPYLDRVEYDRSLQELDPFTRAQLRNGDWDIQPAGEMFNPAWFRVIDEDQLPNVPKMRWIRSWDMAATKSATAAYTSGALMAKQKLGEETHIFISDVVRKRGDPGETEQLIRHTAEMDGHGISIYIEQEGGSGGVNTIWRYQRTVLYGYHVEPFHPRMDKVTRARPVSAAARYGTIYLVRRKGKSNAWMDTFLDEAATFPQHFKDQIDSVSQGFNVLTATADPRLRRL